MKEKIDYLLEMGFSPMTDSPNNTLFKKGSYIITVQSDMTLDELKKEVSSYMKIHDIMQRDEFQKKQEEPAEAQAGSESDGPEAKQVGVLDGTEEENIFKANSEPVDPFFVAEAVKEIQTPIFRRLTLDGNRYYYRLMDNGDVGIYASATNLIKDGYAEQRDGLNEWRQQIKMLGMNPEEVAQYEADKGTIMHYLYGLYLIGRDIYLRRSHIIKLIEESDLRIKKENIKKFKSSIEDLDNMIERLRRFAKFCSDYKVKPILIEKILSCEEYEVASPIDLVCQMSVTEKQEGYFGEVYQRNGNGFKKGDPKKSVKEVERSFFAIIDFKSGYIYPYHAFQLELYRRMVKEWYGDTINIEKIYNFSPKSESNKGYILRDQTDSKELRKADYVYGQGMINHQNKDKTFKVSVGKININEPYNDEDHTVIYNIAKELEKTFE